MLTFCKKVLCWIRYHLSVTPTVCHIVCPSAAGINFCGLCSGYFNKNIVGNLYLLQIKPGLLLLSITNDFSIMAFSSVSF